MSNRTDRRSALPSALKARPGSLVDLMYEGFHALFLLARGNGPEDTSGFTRRMADFLELVEHKAREMGLEMEDIESAKYAFCAALDEIILRSDYAIRSSWETRPLQLKVFGDQMAGEYFYRKLEQLRARSSANLQSLEVFHLCLLMGFQGRYALEGDEKLGFLTARLGEEIARMRGAARPFAPHGLRPDEVAKQLHSDLSWWLLMALFALTALLAFGGFRAALLRDSEQALAAYHDLVKLPARAPMVSITLPETTLRLEKP